MNEDTIYQSLMKITNISRAVLVQIIKEEKYNELYKCLENVDEILIHHLSRKIEGCKHVTDLHTLLLSKNEMTDFFRSKNIRFEKGISEIEMYYKGQRIDIGTCPISRGGNRSRIKQRFNIDSNKDFVDSVINGYTIGDVKSHCLYRNLVNCPEIIEDLAYIIQEEKLKKDFQLISSFYVWSYKVPLNTCRRISGTRYTLENLLNDITYYAIHSEPCESFISTDAKAILEDNSLVHKYRPIWLKEEMH